MKISKEAREAAVDIAWSLDQDGLADGSYFGSLFATKLQSLINSTLDRASTAARDCMVDQEWPPQDGDQQIDEVLEAILALKEDTQ